ncbi:hypothetical protein LguiA_005057 [Lonicera macranthoides]
MCISSSKKLLDAPKQRHILKHTYKIKVVMKFRSKQLLKMTYSCILSTKSSTIVKMF